jgi:aldose 1-epimerase
VAGSSPLDEWTLELPARQYLAVSADRLLPEGVHQVNAHEFDFRTPRRLGTTRIDHAFTGIIRDAEGRAAVRVLDPAGTGVELEWDESWPWVQVHTADKPTGSDRLGLAVEPMTCPPDAFNSGTDLVHLAPGKTHLASWTIRALDQPLLLEGPGVPPPAPERPS